MKLFTIAPRPHEFALAHAGRIAVARGLTSQSQRKKLIAALAEQISSGAQALPLINQLAIVSGMTTTEYARQHTLMPVIRVAEHKGSKLLHGDEENLSLTKFVGARTAVDAAHLCTECVRDDLRAWNASWFRRTHNLPGVETCPIHGAPLHRVISPDPWSQLPEHWVDDGELERVEFDLSSEVRARFQKKLHDTYAFLLERNRPFELIAMRSALAQRTQELGLRMSRTGRKQLLSEFARSRAPREWLQRHWPELESNLKGEFFPALDRLPMASVTPGTGFAYAFALSIMFDDAREAGRALENPRLRTPVAKAIDIVSYPDSFWRTDFLSVCAERRGNVSAIAQYLKISRRVVSTKMKAVGFPSLHGRSNSACWSAVQHFMSGSTLAAACAKEEVDVSDVEDILRQSIKPMTQLISAAENKQASIKKTAK